MRRLLSTLGWIRTAVSALTVTSVAAALHAAGIHPALNLCASGLLALALVRGPFGARYRRNF